MARRRRRLLRSRRPGLDVWGGRLAMLVLFAGLTLALTAGFIYAASDALIPNTPEGVAAAARNRCTPLYEVESTAWFDCLRREPPPPSDDAFPFLRWGIVAGLGGMVLVVVAARGNPRAAIPAFVAAWVLAMGMIRVDRAREDERQTLERLRAEAGDIEQEDAEDDPAEEDPEDEPAEDEPAEDG